MTQTWYDWRDRAVATKAGVQGTEATDVNRPLTYLDYDNLGQATKARVYDADAVTPTATNGVPDAPSASLLRARTDTSYDELGRVYRSDEYGVNQSTGAVAGSPLTSQWWYDARGLVAKAAVPGGRVDKAAYDGAGRPTAAYVTDGGGDAAHADALSVTGDTVWAQAEYAYDAAGNLTKTTDRARVHGQTGTGALGTPTTGVLARVSYAGYYYDLADRPTAGVDVGTNGGTAWTRPSTVPARSDTVLVTSSAYDAAGNVSDVTGPDGAVTHGTFDALGRALTATAAYGTADALSVSYAYDSGGRLLSVTAPGSRQTRYAYDGTGRVSGVTERYGTALARTTQYAYDQTDLPTAVTLANGTALAVTAKAAYDVLGRPVSVTEADGTALARTTSTGYDALGRTVSATGPRGYTSAVAYDDIARTVTATDPYGKGWTTAYDAAGNQTSLTNPYGKAWTWAYDLPGRVTSAADPLANTTKYEYTVTGDRDAVVDPRGYRTERTADRFGRTASVIDPYGNAATFAYDRAGRVVTLTDRRGTPTQFAYDTLGRAKTVTEAAGYAEQRATGYAYTAAGDLDAVTAPGGLVTKYGYDAAGRVTGVTEGYGTALARTTTVGYDLLDRVVSVADPLSHTTAYAFDLLGRVTAATDPLSKATTFGYDAADNLLWVQDAGSNKTQYAYDKLDRVQTETDPLGKNTAYAYDDAGRLVTVTDRLGRVREFGYDAAGRLTGETWKTGGGATVQAQSFGYDAAGNLTSAADPDGTYTVAYDKLNRAETVTGPWGLTLTFGYDPNGNRTSAADNKGATQTTAYDRLNRPTSRTLDTAAGDARVDTTYTAAVGVDVVTRYADLAGATKVGTTDTDYDGLNRVAAITHKNAGGTTLAAYGYAYDAADRLTSKTENGTTTTFGYDNADQLTADGGTSFTYDGAGNRTTAGYTTGAGNRLSSDGTWAYTYDDAGQLVKKSKGASAETWTYTYDHRGQLTAASKSNTDGGAAVAGVSYAYDAWGNRVARTETGAGGATVAADRYAVDGWDTAKPAALGTENFDAWADLDTSNVVTNRRLYGAGFDAVTARVTAGGAVSWYAADLTGSVRLTLSSGGAVTHTAAYTAFGGLASGTLSDSRGYAGRPRDGLTYAYDMRGREYGPDAGRFQTEDPLRFGGGDPNLYRYVRNQPTTYTDPSGLEGRPLPPAAQRPSTIQCHTPPRAGDGFRLSLSGGPGTDDPLAELRRQRQAEAQALAAKLVQLMQMQSDAEIQALRDWETRPQMTAVTPGGAANTRRMHELNRAAEEAMRRRAFMAEWHLKVSSGQYDREGLAMAFAFQQSDAAERRARLSVEERFLADTLEMIAVLIATEGVGLAFRGMQITRMQGGGVRVAQGGMAVELSQAELNALRAAATPRGAGTTKPTVGGSGIDPTGTPRPPGGPGTHQTTGGSGIDPTGVPRPPGGPGTTPGMVDPPVWGGGPWEFPNQRPPGAVWDTRVPGGRWRNPDGTFGAGPTPNQIWQDEHIWISRIVSEMRRRLYSGEQIHEWERIARERANGRLGRANSGGSDTLQPWHPPWRGLP